MESRQILTLSAVRGWLASQLFSYKWQWLIPWPHV